jgi:hypothetical protein
VTHTHELAAETPAADEPEVIAEFVEFLRAASVRRTPSGAMPRFNQGRTSGCVTAEMTVPADLPAELRVGLFAVPGKYAARVRFAHASSDSDTERDVRGMSIKVFDAGGVNLTSGESAHDIILNSHPVMMVGQSREFLALLRANDAGGARRVLFFLSHPRAAAVAVASRQHHSSPLEISYWSTTPYAFGPGRAVKYVAVPAIRTSTPLPDPLTDDYLHERLRGTLAAGDAHFDLKVQLQTDARTMPIEDASVEWSDTASPYRTVARLTIPQQVVDRGTGCERLVFNPWHARDEHRPLGNFNRARRAIYEAMATFRLARH